MDRELWLQRIKLATEADTLPNYSVSEPADGPSGGKKAAFIGEISGPAGGRGGAAGAGGAAAAGTGVGRSSVKPMHFNTSVAVTDFDLLKVSKKIPNQITKKKVPLL